MKKYRLKKEAVPFFKRELTNRVYEYEIWESCNVDMAALEEVEECYITYGISNGSSDSLSGWGDPDGQTTNKGAYFCFTIHFPSMKYAEYDKFQKGKLTRELMNRMQNVVNSFYDSFNNDETEKED